MSTFKGFLSDPSLHFIAIDYFESSTYNCNVFMLSHIHWDHRSGLLDPEFISLMNRSDDKLLYCSSFTAHLLSKFENFTIMESKIVAMDVNRSYVVRNDAVETDIAITCLAAGHCPGSVMFLLEYMGKRILYTGDFRIRVAELQKVKHRLTNDDGTIIPIDELYLDTTFAFRSILDDFPVRESSEKLIIDQIENWLKEIGPSLKVIISLPYRFGIEYLYISLSKRFKKPISVHDYVSYAQVEDISSHVISFEEPSEENWFIHACMQRNRCSLSSYEKLKKIRPCAMNFLRKKNKDSLTVDEKHNVPFDYHAGMWRVFYSSHCSLKELQDVVKYVKPNKIYPNVQSKTMSDEEIVELLLDKEAVKHDGGSGDTKTTKKVLLSRENVDLRKFSEKRSLEERKKRYEEYKKKYHLKF